MSAEVNPSVEEETPEPVAQATEPEVVQEERQETPQEKKRRNDTEYNWAETRRKMQELERQNQELKEYVEKTTAKPAPKEEIDELDKLSDDDIVTKAQAKKMAAKMAREIANEVMKQREAATVEDRLQLKYQDFAEVVTKENIDLLKQTEPELADSLRYHPDPYAQGVAAYKLLKKISTGQSSPPPSPDRDKAIKNSQKPVSVNAVTKASALGNAHLFENGLTPEVKKQLFAEMQAAIKYA